MSERKIASLYWALIALTGGVVAFFACYLLRGDLYQFLGDHDYLSIWGALSVIGYFLFIPVENRIFWLKGSNASYLYLLGSLPPITFGFCLGVVLSLLYFKIGTW